MLPLLLLLLQEFVPRPQRSRWVAFLYSAYGAGRVLTAILAWGLMRSSWRVYMFAIALPSGLMLVLCHWLPETPHFLLMRGRCTEARAIIETAAAANGRPSPLLSVADLLLERQPVVVLRSGSVLWSPAARLLCGMWLLVSLGTEWFNWIVKILEDCGLPQTTVLRYPPPPCLSYALVQATVGC